MSLDDPPDDPLPDPPAAAQSRLAVAAEDAPFLWGSPGLPSVTVIVTVSGEVSADSRRVAFGPTCMAVVSSIP